MDTSAVQAQLQTLYCSSLEHNWLTFWLKFRGKFKILRSFSGHLRCGLFTLYQYPHTTLLSAQQQHYRIWTMSLSWSSYQGLSACFGAPLHVGISLHLFIFGVSDSLLCRLGTLLLSEFILSIHRYPQESRDITLCRELFKP